MNTTRRAIMTALGVVGGLPLVLSRRSRAEAAGQPRLLATANQKQTMPPWPWPANPSPRVRFPVVEADTEQAWDGTVWAPSAGLWLVSAQIMMDEITASTKLIFTMIPNDQFRQATLVTTVWAEPHPGVCTPTLQFTSLLKTPPSMRYSFTLWHGLAQSQAISAFGVANRFSAVKLDS